MLVVMRFETGEAGFAEQAREVLAILAARPGYLSGRLVRAYDDPSLWCLVTEWDSVGSYRRALASYEVKAGATRFLARALPGPSAFEPLASAEHGGQVRVLGSDRSVASRS